MRVFDQATPVPIRESSGWQRSWACPQSRSVVSGAAEADRPPIGHRLALLLAHSRSGLPPERVDGTFPQTTVVFEGFDCYMW
jgi:hypothetical protein